MSEDRRPEFSLFVMWPDEHEPIVRFVDVAAVMRLMRELVRYYEDDAEVVPPDRVIITDGGDFTVVEWKRGEGITFPPDAAVHRWFA